MKLQYFSLKKRGKWSSLSSLLASRGGTSLLKTQLQRGQNSLHRNWIGILDEAPRADGAGGSHSLLLKAFPFVSSMISCRFALMRMALSLLWGTSLQHSLINMEISDSTCKRTIKSLNTATGVAVLLQRYWNSKQQSNLTNQSELWKECK